MENLVYMVVAYYDSELHDGKEIKECYTDSSKSENGNGWLHYTEVGGMANTLEEAKTEYYNVDDDGYVEMFYTKTDLKELDITR